MKNNTIPSFQDILTSSLSGAKIPAQGIFWNAFSKLKDGNRNDTANALRSGYFDDKERKASPRAALIYGLAHRMPLSTDGLGWVEIMASANLTMHLGHLCREGRIEAVHAIHAEIEMNPRHCPNPLLQATVEDFDVLRELYAIENDLLLHYHAKDKRVARWLKQRSYKLADYARDLQI